MHSFLLPISDVDAGHLAAWRELAGRAAEPNPFFEPEFVLPAAARLGADRTCLLVSANRSGDWLACVPVKATSRWKRLPVPALASWRHLYCFLGTPLMAPDSPEESLAALIDEGLSSGGRSGMLAVEWVSGGGAVGSALHSVLQSRSRRPLLFEDFERATLVRRPDGGYLEQTLRAHHRRELRRQARRLGEELGGEVELRDLSDEPDGVDRFLALEAAGWKGRSDTAFASRQDHAQLFRDVCASFAERGRLQLLALMAGNRAAAIKCNLLAGDGVFCFKIAYDESLSRFSPGVQLEERMVELFHSDMEESWMDSCADPDNEMINRLWPDRRVVVSYVIPAGGAVGWASLRGVEAALQFHNRTRRAS
jgi:CelD/BcsL family acetyltransferase involved in cellulose biosynthesis